MTTVNIHEAKTHLSQLIEKAVHGEPFIIAKAGKPLVKVTSVETSAKGHARRIGFLKGLLKIPRSFDRMASKEIEQLFYGEK
jgi:prevent-host-death family protein